VVPLLGGGVIRQQREAVQRLLAEKCS